MDISEEEKIKKDVTEKSHWAARSNHICAETCIVLLMFIE